MIDLKKICRIVEKKVCRTHNENPKAEVIKQSIKITTCCEKFEKEMVKFVEVELEKEVDRKLDDMLFN